MATRQRIKRTIPDNIKDLKGYPLYILVAHWGLRLNKIITTVDVSRVFMLTQQQARDVLHYIYHDARKSIACEKRVLINAQNRRIVAIKITAISDEIYQTPKKEIKYHSTDNAQALRKQESLPKQPLQLDTLTTLRRWMCSRRPGERAGVLINV
ncbi:TPA: CaiF/GrlA family transcriptional regulator [Escherichia coli]